MAERKIFWQQMFEFLKIYKSTIDDSRVRTCNEIEKHNKNLKIVR